MLNKLYQKYIDLILDTKPGLAWKSVRFVIHWITLPIKLLLIGGLGMYQIFRQELFVRRRMAPPSPTLDVKQKHLLHVINKLPVYTNSEKKLQLYVNRVPYTDNPTGFNHNTDHQAARHGVYAFAMRRLGLNNELIDNALSLHMRNGKLARGYRWDQVDKAIIMNYNTVSGDMLIGASMGMMDIKKEIIFSQEDPDKILDVQANYLFEAYDVMLENIINNDYALLEGSRPEDGDINQAMWDRIQKYNEKAINPLTMKSLRACWQPGLETVGAQALTILAAVRIGDKIIGASYAKKEYKKLLWRYGYGLLSLIPTAFTQDRRGYFNDSNCMQALYILSRLADGKLGRLFWKIPMMYVWLLSRKWHNPFFTGLLEDAHPGTVSEKYIDATKAYLYEEEPNLTHYFEGSMDLVPKEYPVKFNEMNQQEFMVDEPQTKMFKPPYDEGLRVNPMWAVPRYRTGLGFLISMVMLEKNPKELMNVSNAIDPIT
jgi:hypothetical protein